MVDSTVLVRWFGNHSRTFDGRSAKIFLESILSVNGNKTTDVSKLVVGDVLELDFPGDSKVWKAVVIENGGGGGETRVSGRLVRTPNPWWRERPGDSGVDGRRTSGRPTLPPVRYRDRDESESPPSEKTVTKLRRSRKSNKVCDRVMYNVVITNNL